MNDTINALATESNNIIGNLGNNENSEIYGDDIWINDYKILFTKDNLSKFVPTVNMTNIEKYYNQTSCYNPRGGCNNP